MQPRVARRGGGRLWVKGRDGASAEGAVRQREDDRIGFIVTAELRSEVGLRVSRREPELPVACASGGDPPRRVLEEIPRGEFVHPSVRGRALRQLEIVQPLQRDRDRALRDTELASELTHGRRRTRRRRELQEDEQVDGGERSVHDWWTV